MILRQLPPLLDDVMPDFANELRDLLRADAPELAAQVAGLRLHGRCTCGDSFCSMFYTAPLPDGSYGPTLRTLALSPEDGMVILDVVDGRIAAVEVLYRNDVRAALDRAEAGARKGSAGLN